MNYNDFLDHMRGLGYVLKEKDDSATCNCPACDGVEPKPNDSAGHFWIAPADNGGVVIKCIKECDKATILGAIGLKLSDLMPPKEKKKSWADRIEATYDYTDENGNLLFQTVRLKDPKDFRQRHKDAVSDAWVWNLKGVHRVIYRLPDVLKAKADGKIILIVEGEKDADNGARLGLHTTCNPMGAGKWNASYSESLRGATVYIIPDNDPDYYKDGKPHRVGQKHAMEIARSLAGFAAKVCVLELPPWNDFPVKDLSDFIAAGGDINVIQDVAKQRAIGAGAWVDEQQRWWDDQPLPRLPETQGKATGAPETGMFEGADGEEVPREQSQWSDLTATDIAAATRLVETHGQDIEFCESDGTWYVWDGMRWEAGHTASVQRRASDTARAYTNLVEREIDNGDGKATRAAKTLEGASRISGAVLLSRGRRLVKKDDFDADPWILNTRSGSIDLRDGTIHPHAREQRISRLMDVEIDPESTCPRWEQFVSEVMAGDADMVSFLQRWWGYCLTGSIREECLVFAVGTGANGKSVMIDTIQQLVGNDYSVVMPRSLLLTKKNGPGHPADINTLRGKRLAIGNETGGGNWETDLVKALTGDAGQNARGMNQNFKAFSQTHKLVIAGNDEPHTRDNSYAFWRRFRIVRFPVRFEGANRDDKLKDKLRAERAGIFNWLIMGAVDWFANGLGEPSSVVKETAAYREREDSIGSWDKEYRENSGETTSVQATVLHASYAKWCEGVCQPESTTAFGKRLLQLGWTKRRNEHGSVWTFFNQSSLLE